MSRSRPFSKRAIRGGQPTPGSIRSATKSSGRIPATFARFANARIKTEKIDSAQIVHPASPRLRCSVVGRPLIVDYDVRRAALPGRSRPRGSSRVRLARVSNGRGFRRRISRSRYAADPVAGENSRFERQRPIRLGSASSGIREPQTARSKPIQADFRRFFRWLGSHTVTYPGFPPRPQVFTRDCDCLTSSPRRRTGFLRNPSGNSPPNCRCGDDSVSLGPSSPNPPPLVTPQLVPE